MVIAENAPFPRSGRVVGGNRVLVDTEGGHTASMLTQVWKSFPLVVITRPDACIGAFVHDAEGVAKYFSKILVCGCVQLRTLLSSLDTIQKVLGLTHLSWLVASIEEFPGIPARKLAAPGKSVVYWVRMEDERAETVKHPSRIRALCFSSSTRAWETTRHTIPLLLDFTPRTLKILQGRQPSPLTSFISRVYYIAHAKHRYPAALFLTFTNGLPFLSPTSSTESMSFGVKAPTPCTCQSEDVRFSVPVTSHASSSSPSPSGPAFPLVADECTQTPTSLATEGTADPKGSTTCSASSLRLPVFAPPRLHHPSVQHSYPPSLRSSIHSSSGNPSTSRQNASRPRGAPHLPHIRNTPEIVFPQPLTPTIDTRHALRTTSSQARLTGDHLPSESQYVFTLGMAKKWGAASTSPPIVI
ncbi:hypothetical protein BS47DRAFT_1393122 [Hydnum rufescens UP504]|uniref:Uncharacterized protein n=1 Tax=Hydnum rufescens UP504 TaxID=1448309 RepID=A0A9P6AXQ8_9AGAM|nr:hypothetical protein BS47DRAFT_1393122 [Hydnum rufescens UP504]